MPYIEESGHAFAVVFSAEPKTCGAQIISREKGSAFSDLLFVFETKILNVILFCEFYCPITTINYDIVFGVTFGRWSEETSENITNSVFIGSETIAEVLRLRGPDQNEWHNCW